MTPSASTSTGRVAGPSPDACASTGAALAGDRSADAKHATTVRNRILFLRMWAGSVGWRLTMLGDESRVGRHRLGSLTGQCLKARHLISRHLDRNDVGQRIVAPRPYSLADEHRQPIGLDEQLVILEGHPPAAAKQIDAIGQRVGNLHVAAVTPQG